jgi:acyl-CoA thioester hydrolase
MSEARPALDRRSESRVRVRYAETDRMGVAYHGEYLPWFEVGRTDWLRCEAEGRSYRRLERAGWFLPVVELRARYHSPARYDDEVVVRTRLAEASRARMVFEYEAARAADDRLLATGSTVHAVTDGEGRPRRLPADVFAWILGERVEPPALID